MSLPFMKLSGAGNDFVIMDNRDGVVPATREFISNVCARRISVGADGLLLVEQPDDPAGADFRMRYFNADGGEAETCGNGARCIARFAHLSGIVGSTPRFETLAGVYEAEVLGDQVKVRMGEASGLRLAFPLRVGEEEYSASFANTGVPHVVVYVDDLENVSVVELGRSIRHHEEFAPAGTNANFVHVRCGNAIDLRTYERGVEDETLACGTGSIAAAVVSGLLGKVEPPVTVRTRSGFDLTIHFGLSQKRVHDVFLEGDARVIYRGELELDAWEY